MGKITEGVKSWQRTGQLITDAELTELKGLKEASKSRALSTQEENRLFVLNQKNQTRTRVLE